MLKPKDFQEYAPHFMAWIEEYLKNIRSFPVKSQVRPGEIKALISEEMPLEGTDPLRLLEQFKSDVLPGMTHWNHPNFHAYFPANQSVESLLGEFLTAALGAQCMIWDTSPSAAELEERMMQWLGQALGLPKWEGVIQDTASSATLVALICAREKGTGFSSNEYGLSQRLKVYASEQTHSSIEKGVGIAGLGRKNYVKVPTKPDHSMDVQALEQLIKQDLAEGSTPCAVVVTIGTTGTLAIDSLKEAVEVCKKYDIWCHVDAAYSGSALILEENRGWIEGIEEADSFVFNPHKWLFTHFDCSAYFVKDVDHLLKCFEILPEYLKTKSRGEVNDYRDWGIPLGRRFRALKLWFVLAGYGLQNLQDKLRKHVRWARKVEEVLEDWPNLEFVVKGRQNGVFIGYNSGRGLEEDNRITLSIKDGVNETGKAYIIHTKINGRVVLRVIFGQTYLEYSDIEYFLDVLRHEWEKYD